MRRQPTPPVWTLAGHTATLGAPSAAASVRLDLATPAAGLQPLDGSAGGAPQALLGLDLRGPTRLVDHWARHADLTAIYESDDARQVRTTALWRPLDHVLDLPRDVRAWEVIVSAQTARLLSDPALAVVSDLVATHSRGWSGAAAGWATATATAPPAGALLLETPAAAATVLVAAYAPDGRCVETPGESDRVRVACPLFEHPLEKGVLLRSRILAASGPAADDTAWATQLVQRYRGLPPMLDT